MQRGDIAFEIQRDDQGIHLTDDFRSVLGKVCHSRRLKEIGCRRKPLESPPPTGSGVGLSFASPVQPRSSL